MLNHQMDFKKRSVLLYRNVCDFPEKIAFPAYDEELVEGLSSFRNLLLAIYQDSSAYMAEDDLKSFHNITYTSMFFLKALASSAELSCEGNEYYLGISKADFKKAYKKPSVLPFSALENYGIYFEFFKKEKKVEDYGKCDYFRIHFENDKALALALKYLGEHVPETNSLKDYASATELFGKADFDTIILGSSPKRVDIDPLRPDILRTVGKMMSIWKKAVEYLKDQPDILFSCNYFAYVCPQWIIHVNKKNKKVGTFNLSYDLIRFTMGLSYEQLNFLATNKDNLGKKVQKSLENLHCIRCGRCTPAGGAIEVSSNISICPKESFERELVINIDDFEDVMEIIPLIKMLNAHK